MPIIANIGRRSWGVRLLFAAIYLVLIVGGLSMLYPFVLMISTSITGETDVKEFRLLPRYLTEREDRYSKFIAEKYQNPGDYAPLHAGDYRQLADVGLPTFRGDPAPATGPRVDPLNNRPRPPRFVIETDQAHMEARVAAWQKFKATLPPEDYGLWYVGRRNLPGAAEMAWRQFLRDRFGGDIDSLNRTLGKNHGAFTELFAPYERVEARQWPGVAGEEGKLWREFKSSSQPEWRRPVDGTAIWQNYLKFRYEGAQNLNLAAGTRFAGIKDIPLPATRPANAVLAREWDHLISSDLPARFVAGDSIITPDRRFVAFVKEEFGGDLKKLNAAWDAKYAAFNEIRPPYEEEDLLTFQQQQGAWMRWFLVRNYREVIDYVAVRGRALWNTLILVSSMILCALTVNPLAAYALSRFRLSYANQILLFLLATMAFPHEVTMIPNFLLLRSFPLWTWGIALACGLIVVLVVVTRTRGRARWLALPAGLTGALLGAFYLPPLIGRMLGIEIAPVSLLNTFAALILPRLANGYGIFLLKGFFDSLPEEIFEAGRIDGAGELRMLWQIAFPLSTPILAVMTLQTFTAVYGSYLWALVVCQDDRMWTLMVYIFQLQQWAPQYITMAAAVLASLPTLIIFICAQNVIMRGIIIPAYK